jgi:hypothetical protein
VKKTKIILCLALVLSGALAVLLAAGAADQLLGLWEVDVDATVAQYEKVPAGWEPTTLAGFQDYLRETLTDKTYRFASNKPQKPDWGETNFQGSVEFTHDGKTRYYGAWRTSTNQPDAYEVFVFSRNSGTMSYWAVGNIRVGTNESRALWYQDAKDKPLVLRRK